MIRVLLYFALLALIAYGLMWLVEHPGHVTIDWLGQTLDTSAALLLFAIGFAAVLLWVVLRFLFGLPSILSFVTRQRRREKGYAALSRGLVAVGAGDGYTAGRASSQATRLLKDDPLALMLKAQAAHLNEDGYAARTTFETLAQRDDTRILGLRGLFAEANRRGDLEAARYFAAAADRAMPLPWSTQAVLEHRASERDWERALATVEAGLTAKLIDKDAGDRQRAVLETAIALDKETTDPSAALDLARRAIRRAPDLAPPVVLAARLYSRKGDIRKASRLIESAWPRCQHPDIARAYLDVRPGDSTSDRLDRAKKLMGIASYDPVSRMIVARAALSNRDFPAARSAVAPLIAEGKRPTVRLCMLMAELEESEHGDVGLWREWIARAARAPLDPAWVADGVVYDQWAPVSPTTGKLDAFRWQVPAERLGPAMEALPSRAAPALAPAPALTPTDVTPPAHLPSPEPKPSSLSEGSPEPKPSSEPKPSPAPSMLFHRRIEEVETAPLPQEAEPEAKKPLPEAKIEPPTEAAAEPSSDVPHAITTAASEKTVEKGGYDVAVRQPHGSSPEA